MTFCLNFVSTKDSGIEGGVECNIPGFDHDALNIHDM